MADESSGFDIASFFSDVTDSALDVGSDLLKSNFGSSATQVKTNNASAPAIVAGKAAPVSAKPSTVTIAGHTVNTSTLLIGGAIAAVVLFLALRK